MRRRAAAKLYGRRRARAIAHARLQMRYQPLHRIFRERRLAKRRTRHFAPRTRCLLPQNLDRPSRPRTPAARTLLPLGLGSVTGGRRWAKVDRTCIETDRT